jgi:hypothetical protein
MLTSPPVVAVPDITDMTIFPPLPSVAAPVLNLRLPDEPLLVVPVMKDRLPLVPAAPAFLDCTSTEPLEVRLLIPVVNEIEPPVPPFPSPASTLKWPP